MHGCNVVYVLAIISSVSGEFIALCGKFQLAYEYPDGVVHCRSLKIF